MSFLIPSLKDRAQAIADAQERRNKATPEKQREAQQAVLDALAQSDDQTLMMATRRYLSHLNPLPGHHFFSDFNALSIAVRDQVAQPHGLDENIFPDRLKTALIRASERQLYYASPEWKDMFQSMLEQKSCAFSWRDAQARDQILVLQQQRKQEQFEEMTARHAQTLSPALEQAQLDVLRTVYAEEPLGRVAAQYMAQLDPTPGQHFYMNVANLYTQVRDLLPDGHKRALREALATAYQERFPNATHAEKYDFGTVIEIPADWGDAQTCWRQAYRLDQSQLKEASPSLSQAVQTLDNPKAGAAKETRQALVAAVVTAPATVEAAAQAYFAQLDPTPGKTFFQDFNALHIQVREQQGRQAWDSKGAVFSEATQAALLRAYTAQYPAAHPAARAHFEQVVAQGPALAWNMAANRDEDVKVEAQLDTLPADHPGQRLREQANTARRRTP